MLSSDVKRPNMKPPPEIGGQLLGVQRLRSGAMLIATNRIIPISDSDRALIAEVRSKLEVHLEKQPASNLYIEANWCEFSPQAGNVIAIIPTGYETVSVKPVSSSSQVSAQRT
jgi:hypothetical protein